MLQRYENYSVISQFKTNNFIILYRLLHFKLFSILIPPASGIAEGIDALTDEVWILGGEFGGIEACNDAEER